MDIVKQNIDELSALLKVQITKSDYEENVKKTLNNHRRKAEIKGFRPGMVPMSLIQKIYGTSALVEEINKLISESLEKYFTDENPDIVGEPIPCEEEQQKIDWENQSDFEFVYEIGYAPKYELEINQSIEIPFYNISISDDDKNKYLKDLCRQNAKYADADTVGNNDLTKVDLIQQGEHSVNVNDTYISLRMLKSDEQKSLLIGLKVGDTIKVDINKLFNDDEHAAKFFKVKKEELPKENPEYELTVKEIKTLKDAEVNQELFDILYGKDEVTSEEEFLQRISEEITRVYKEESNYKFAVDLRETLIAKADLKFPEAFLKKWLKFINKNKHTDEEIDKNFDAFLKDLCWETIINNIAKENDITVDEEEINSEAIEIAYRQLQKYGMNNLSTEKMKNFVSSILEDKNQVHEIKSKILGNKIVASLKTVIKLDEKTVSFDEFAGLFEKIEHTQ